jgi:hypothetical protein
MPHDGVGASGDDFLAFRDLNGGCGKSIDAKDEKK